MEINRSNVFEIVEKASLKPDKDYGQNFLVEPQLCERIVNALDIQENDSVIEVGPGLGSLTHFLSLNKADISVVDIDKRMIGFLNIVYKESNIRIIENDIRKVDVSNYNKVLGNLPYNITTETIQYFLVNATKAEKMVFMIQSETFAHFFDVTGKEYGPTSVLIHLLGKIERLFTVKPGSFYPAPKCNSVVFSINIDTRVNRNAAIKAFNLAKQLFVNRRKTIQNNLLSYLKNKDTVNKLCEDLKINPLSRPEQLLPEIYLSISEYLENK